MSQRAAMRWLVSEVAAVMMSASVLGLAIAVQPLRHPAVTTPILTADAASVFMLSGSHPARAKPRQPCRTCPGKTEPGAMSVPWVGQPPDEDPWLVVGGEPIAPAASDAPPVRVTAWPFAGRGLLVAATRERVLARAIVRWHRDGDRLELATERTSTATDPAADAAFMAWAQQALVGIAGWNGVARSGGSVAGAGLTVVALRTDECGFDRGHDDQPVLVTVNRDGGVLSVDARAFDPRVGTVRWRLQLWADAAVAQRDGAR